MRRIGKFTLPAHFFRSSFIEPLAAVQKKVVVLHFDCLAWSDLVEVIGVSEEFEMVEDGFVVPIYKCEITELEDLQYDVSFSKS